MKQIIIVAPLIGWFMLMNSSAYAQIKLDSDPVRLTTQLVLDVKGMACQVGCANGIDNMLSRQNGIHKSKTTYVEGTSLVWFDSTKIFEDQIIVLIEDRGFKVKKAISTDRDE